MPTKSGKETTENRFYLCSREPDELTHRQWIELTRSHWAVENRNHFRRDASMGEDTTRSHHPKTLANLALLRSALLSLYSREGSDDWLPAKRERFAADPQQAFRLLKLRL